MLALVAPVAPVVSGAALAQDARVVVFSDPGFNGPSRPFTRANPDLRQPVTVRSVRVEGGPWELCERTRFRKPCVTLGASTSTIARETGWRGTMLSLRPADGKKSKKSAET